MAWRFQAPCCLLAYAPRQAHIPIIPTMRPIIRAAASPPSNAETWSKRQAKTIAKNTWNTPPAAIFDFTCNTKRHVMSHVWCHCPVGMKTYRVGVVRISFAFDFSNVLSQKWIIYFFTQIAVYAINIFVFFQTYVWHIYICTHLYQGPLMFLSIVHCYLLFVSWYLAGNLRRAAPRRATVVKLDKLDSSLAEVLAVVDVVHGWLFFPLKKVEISSISVGSDCNLWAGIGGF